MGKEEKRIFTWALSLTLMLLLALGCNKDDGPLPPKPDVIDKPDPEPEPVNNPPGTFGLISPEVDAEHEVLMPTFAWQASTDPDGDAVTYDLYIGTETNPQTVLATAISDTTFVPNENLELFANYHWKVVAKDGKGGEINSAVQKFVIEPRLYLSEFHRSGEVVKFGYNQQDQLTIFDDFELKDESRKVLYNLEGAIRTLDVPKTGLQNYSYDLDGRLVEIQGDDLGNSVLAFKIEYGDTDQIKGFTLEFPGGSRIHTTITYNDRFLPISALFESYGSNQEINGERRVTLEWDDNGNLIKKLSEWKKEDGFVFHDQTTYSYDNKQNPWYWMIKDKFRFGQLFVNSFFADLETQYVSQQLYWQSKNNITQSTEQYRDGDNLEQVTKKFDYTYNEEGFPIGATVTVDGPELDYSIEYNWKYLP